MMTVVYMHACMDGLFSHVFFHLQRLCLPYIASLYATVWMDGWMDAHNPYICQESVCVKGYPALKYQECLDELFPTCSYGRDQGITCPIPGHTRSDAHFAQTDVMPPQWQSHHPCISYAIEHRTVETSSQ